MAASDDDYPAFKDNETLDREIMRIREMAKALDPKENARAARKLAQRPVEEARAVKRQMRKMKGIVGS